MALLRTPPGCETLPGIVSRLIQFLVLPALVYLSALLGLSVGPMPAACQEQVPVTATATPSVVLPDHELRSPRATVATFLSAMDPSDGSIDLERAIKTLDVSEIPDLVKSERAEEVAVKLYAALDFIDFTPNKAPSSTPVDAIQITDIAGFGVYLERGGPNWRFSKVTVTDIPAIFREIEPNLSKKAMRQLGGTVSPWLTIRTYVPEAFKDRTFLIEDWQWIAGVVAIVLLLILHRIIIKLLRWLLVSILSPRLGLPPILNLRPLERPLAITLFTLALQVLLLTTDLPIDVHSTAIAWLATIRVIALAVLGVYLVEIIGERLAHRASRTSSTVDDILFPLLQRAAWLLVILTAVAQVLSVHGVNVSGLVAGLGLGGLAFALAAKDTVENIFGSVAILLDQPFRVGDTINVGGLTGTVEQIGLRSTRLRTPENSLVSMPNSKVIAGHVDNLGARPFLRTRIILPLSFDTPPEAIESLCAGTRELLRSHPLCKKDSIVVHLNEVTNSGLGVLVQFHLLTRDWVAEQSLKDQIFIAILTLVRSLGIRLPAAIFDGRSQSVGDVASQPHDDVSPERAIAQAKAIKVGWSRVS